jgi:hypothetical protein
MIELNFLLKQKLKILTSNLLIITYTIFFFNRYFELFYQIYIFKKYFNLFLS